MLKDGIQVPKQGVCVTSENIMLGTAQFIESKDQNVILRYHLALNSLR